MSDLIIGVAYLTMIFAWITHVAACIKAGTWFLLVIGCFIAPVGVIHGVGLWLGVF